MPVIAQEVAVEVRPQPVDQLGDARPVSLGYQLGELIDLTPVTIGSTDDLAMLKIRDEQHLPHQELSGHVLSILHESVILRTLRREQSPRRGRPCGSAIFMTRADQRNFEPHAACHGHRAAKTDRAAVPRLRLARRIRHAEQRGGDRGQSAGYRSPEPYRRCP